jgi:hypothetical protein
VIDFLERAAKLPQSSPAALDKLRRRIDLAAKFVDKSWTANKIAAYFDVTEVDLLRELRRAGKKLPVEVKEQTFYKRVKRSAASPDAMRRIKRVYAASEDLGEVVLALSSWFEGDSMSIRYRGKAMQDKSIRKTIAGFRAIRAGYPVKAGKLFRCTLIKLKSASMSNAKVLKIKRFVPGDKPVQSWTTSPSIAEKFYTSFHASSGRGKTSNYAWVVLEADARGSAYATVDTVHQFLVDVLECRDELISSGIIAEGEENGFWTRRFSLQQAIKRLASSFIQSQREVVCASRPGKAIPCTIYKILRRGSIVRKNYNY